MRRCKLQIILPVVAGLTLLSACGQNAETDGVSGAASVELANGMTVKEQIEARQSHLKKIGKAFKTISDQLKASSPDLAQIQAAAASVPKEATGMAGWFPEGTGPESGVKTDALPIIWEEKADFEDKVAAMQEAAVKLDTVAQGGDVAAIGAAFKTTGGTCKACHDKFREDD
ncbi:MAG: cytochrome c [Sphingomonadales bacterium]|nr:cytochrome c [Sphingomonadales bacterium]NCO49252.1 cytochrome c [Sphingomonadales bacterium]NCP01231.1 cytochrome c [Sphingomonadales bacterium]NCP26655.1 cytochrome c [Sphingomonadales bacterium]NCP42986.1 cytochrome c [Sphingomonadales bacterium]